VQSKENMGLEVTLQPMADSLVSCGRLSIGQLFRFDVAHPLSSKSKKFQPGLVLGGISESPFGPPVNPFLPGLPR
jgi:hypothetical protein